MSCHQSPDLRKQILFGSRDASHYAEVEDLEVALRFLV
jgi:hypothetical protein